MNISPTGFQNFKASTPARKLVPLSEYKGPVLKLTEADKEKIAEIRDFIIKLEMEIFKLERYHKFAKYTNKVYDDIICTLKHGIEAASEEIREIKIARMQQQRENKQICHS